MAGIATYIWFKHDLGMSFTDEAASRIPSALAIRDFGMTDHLVRTPRRCCRSTPQAAFKGQLVGRALPVVVCEVPVQARAVLEAQLANRSGFYPLRSWSTFESWIATDQSIWRRVAIPSLDHRTEAALDDLRNHVLGSRHVATSGCLR